MEHVTVMAVFIPKGGLFIVLELWLIEAQIVLDMLTDVCTASLIYSFIFSLKLYIIFP